MIPVEKEGYINPEETLERVKTLLDLAKAKGWTDEELYWAVKLLHVMFY